MSFVKYDKGKAEHLFKITTETDEAKELVLKLMNSKKTVKQQIEEFIELTGKSRMTFFRIKKSIKVSSDRGMILDTKHKHQKGRRTP